MTIRERIRVRLARHENLYTALWYLHLVKNEEPKENSEVSRVRKQKGLHLQESQAQGPLLDLQHVPSLMGNGG